MLLETQHHMQCPLWLVNTVVLLCWGKQIFGAKYCIFNVKKFKKYIRMRVTIFKIFIWGGISSYIWLEITFYTSTDMLRKNQISNHILDDIPPQMIIFNIVIPCCSQSHITFVRYNIHFWFCMKCLEWIFVLRLNEWQSTIPSGVWSIEWLL